MPSQFFGLYIAGSGLRASNAALNTTANNIANAQTDGYSRQQATQQASEALRTFTTYGCAGAGVDTIAIERIRDSFYDVKYWSNNTNYGEFSVKQYYAKTIENYFDDDTSSGFNAIFNKMSNALQSVTTNSSSKESKAQFLATVKSLTDYFNNMYGNLQELQKDVNLEIKQCVDQVNSIAQKIATLNKQINTIELSGSKANELRDQRDKLVDELSQIVDVEIRETPIKDKLYPDIETGATRYLVRIAGGQVLVDGNDYKTLVCEARDKDEKVNQSDANGLYRIKWDNGNQFSLANAAMGGKLKGLVELRDGNDGANFRGEITGVTPRNPADPLSQSKVMVEVSDEYLKNMQECTLSSTGGVIHLGNKVYYYESWTFDQATNTYTFTMDDADGSGHQMEKGDTSLLGKTAKTESEIKYQGIPYYMEQMNEWIRGFAEAINKIFTEGTDAYGNPGGVLFTGYNGAGYEYQFNQKGELLLLDGSGKPIPDPNKPGEFLVDPKGYYELTAGNFAVNSKLLADASLLGTRSSDKVGVEECGQIEEMIKLIANKEIFSFRNGTAGQLLDMILSDITLNASDADMFYDTYSALQVSIDNQRSSISGVDEDEEAVSLVKFQSNYTLASKMIQTLTEVYDQLILRTGV